MYFRLMGKLNARRQGLLAEEEKGFTLIELLVVVIIIGILAAIAIPVYLGVQNNAKDNAVKADLTNIVTAVVAYQTDGSNAAAPDSVGDLGDSVKINTDNYDGGNAPDVIQWDSATAPKHFCVTATSKTGTKFAASDVQSPKKDSVCASGEVTAAP